MELGMIGLGRMGTNMVRHLLKAGHHCVVYDIHAEAVQALAKEKAVGTTSLEDCVHKLSKPRALWMMVLAAAVEQTLTALVPLLERGDVVIDGGKLLLPRRGLGVRYRSAEPVLTPVLAQERQGTIANVVFPTGIDRRDDIGAPNRFDVYYGMADNWIGAARLDVPEHLPAGVPADHLRATASFPIDGAVQAEHRQIVPNTISGGSSPL